MPEPQPVRSSALSSSASGRQIAEPVLRRPPVPFPMPTTPPPSSVHDPVPSSATSGRDGRDGHDGQDRQDATQRIPYWLQQAERFMRVIVRMYLGLLVCFAPWYPPAWDANPLFLHSPPLLAFVTKGAVRGIVSGIGILNLWVALRDAMHAPENSGRR